MCFINEADWVARESAEYTYAATQRIKCCECRELVGSGALVHYLWLQEYDECQRCEDGECECPDVEYEGSMLQDCCQCAEPTYGETAELYTCDNCYKFLQAVEATELAAGCRAYEARPLPEMMYDDIQEGGSEEAKKYWKQAICMFPELRTSGYLGRLWRKMFVR